MRLIKKKLRGVKTDSPEPTLLTPYTYNIHAPGGNMTEKLCEKETVKRHGYKMSDHLKRLSSKGLQIRRNSYARGTTPGTILTHVEL